MAYCFTVFYVAFNILYFLLFYAHIYFHEKVLGNGIRWDRIQKRWSQEKRDRFKTINIRGGVIYFLPHPSPSGAHILLLMHVNVNSAAGNLKGMEIFHRQKIIPLGLELQTGGNFTLIIAKALKEICSPEIYFSSPFDC